MSFKSNSTTQAFASDTVPALFGTGNTSPLETNHNSSNITSLIHSDASTLDWFGAFCRTGYGKILISAHRKGLSGTTTSSNDFAGAVYAFDTEGNNQIKMVEPGIPAVDRNFGYGIGITDRGYVIGSYVSNAVYLFDYNGNTSNVTTLTSNTVAATAYFGYVIAANCGKIAVGGRWANADKIHVYDSDGSNEQILELSDDLFPAYVNVAEYTASANVTSGVNFGAGGSNRIAIGSDRIIVGATTFPNDYEMYYTDNNGAAFVYDTDLNYIMTLRPSDRYGGPAANNNGSNKIEYGHSVAVGCGRIAVGTWWKARPVTQPFNGVGAVYLYDMSGKEIAILDPEVAGYSVSAGANTTSSNGGINHFMAFGNQIVINGGRVYVSAPDWDGAQGELNGGGGIFQFTLDGDFIQAWRPTATAAGDHWGGASGQFSPLDVRDGIMVAGAYAGDTDGSASGKAYIVPAPDTITPQDLKDMNESLI